MHGVPEVRLEYLRLFEEEFLQAVYASRLKINGVPALTFSCLYLVFRKPFFKDPLTSCTVLHSLTLIHTDLKPENILFVNSDAVTVNDSPADSPSSRSSFVCSPFSLLVALGCVRQPPLPLTYLICFF